MARGWESKNVEEQMESHRMPGVHAVRKDADVGRQRVLADLRLRRENILDQRTAHPQRRAALHAALAAVEEELRALGEAI